MSRIHIALRRFYAFRVTHHAWLIGGLIVAGLLAWVFWPKPPQPLRASLIEDSRQEMTACAVGFARAEGLRPLAFPTDHGPHDDFQTEWWYYTGNLTAETGEHFGYQLTFFRRALAPPDRRSARDSAWAADQVYMAHLALTDVSGGKHYAFEKLARGAAGLAGAQAVPFRVWLEGWEVAEAANASGIEALAGTSGQTAPPARLRASTTDASGLNLSLDLNLTDLKGPTLNGDRGYSRKGPEPGNASYYVSLPRIATGGTITIGSKAFTVDGLSWMDHEWSTSALGAEQAGWDWFSIQLDDGTELMLFQLRRADGRADGFSSGTLIADDGSTRALGPGDFSIEAADRWRSPRTGATYPSGWTLTVPSADLRLTLTPWLADQEMDLSYAYWEGAAKAVGTRNGQQVAGNGYVELTGYAGSMQGQF